MNRGLAEHIVNCLHFSGSECDYKRFREIRSTHWKCITQWLDDCGLAFYFLHKLKEDDATATVPPWVISQLEANYSLNLQRTEDLLDRFDRINAKFSEAGIPFAVLKGLSLVPEFCPSSALRHQGDLDYLVDSGSLPVAREILLGLGYTEKESPSSLEALFLSPGASAPLRGGRQYSPRAPHAVELHLDMWDPALYRLPALPRIFSPERATSFQHNGIVFPALNDEDAFVLQVIHACHHMFTQWIRTSSLYEIGYFLTRRASDRGLWNRVEQRVGASEILREFVVIVTAMAAKMFACPIPLSIRVWGERLRPGVKLWLEKYAKTWVLSDFPVYDFSLLPTSKLVIFLHQQYPPAPVLKAAENRVPAQALSRPWRMLSAIRRDPSLFLDAQWWKQQRLLRRTFFHGLGRLRYMYEIPRWRWLMRRMKKSTVSPPPRVNPIAECVRTDST